MNIADFVRARLDEDEQIAQAAQQGGRGNWVAFGEEVYAVGLDLSCSSGRCDQHAPGIPNECDDTLVADVAEDRVKVADHMVRHDPVRTLVDIEAKRALVDYWSRAFQNPIDADKFPGHDWDLVRGAARWTLRYLATPYASHPDYQPEWTP